MKMQNRYGLVFIAGLIFATGPAFGQAAPASQTAESTQSTPTAFTFDVASVRPAATLDQATIIAGLRAGKRPESMKVEGLRATFTYMSLKELIAYAYNVRVYQVSGPDWMLTDRFDISANMPDGSTRDNVPDMLQALLKERFNLTAHLEAKDHPVLGLMVAKSGAKLIESTTPPVAFDVNAPLKPGESQVDTVDGPIRLMRSPDGSTTYNMGARGKFTIKVDGDNGVMHLSGSAMTLKGFAVMLTSLGGGNGRQVVDMTGLTGRYELAVEFALTDLVSSLRDQGINIQTGPPGGGAGADASDPGGNFTVAQSLGKLGLKLESTHAVVQQLIVDHVDKDPTEN
jgi:uncharacterized protein (TIGR03435 family)